MLSFVHELRRKSWHLWRLENELPGVSREQYFLICRAAVVAYVEHCQESFSITDERGGGVEIGLGQNSCPMALLYHPTGYSAMVRNQS
jgi:hypothetical protein